MKTGMASCRLPHDRLRELPEDMLVIAKAEEADIAAIESIAKRALGYER